MSEEMTAIDYIATTVLAEDLCAAEERITTLEAEVEQWKGERGRLAAELAEVSTERDRLAAENAKLTDALMEAMSAQISEDALATEVDSLRATLAEVQQSERWLASVKWEARLSLLAADFRDRASILRGTTTWEQAYRQAAIDLEEVIEQMAKASPEPAKEPQREAEIIDLMEALKASLAVAPKRKE